MKVSHYQALAAFDRVTPDQVAQAARYPVAVVGDMAGRRGAMNARIQALGPGMKLAGPAFTVECRPGDNLMVHVAAAIARPGDILVVDARNDQTCALIGELLVAQLRAAGVAGAVIDSAVRDTAELAHGPMPIFASGRNPCGPTKNVPGRLGIPISCGGAPVSPGDLVLGDEDGVMVIPRAEVPGVLGQLDAKMAAEAQRLKEISEGRLISPWVDEAMRAAGILDAGESLIAAFDGRR